MCYNRKKIIDKAIHKTSRSVTFPDLQSIRSIGYLFSGEQAGQEAIWQNAGVSANFSYLTYLNGKRGDDNRVDVIYRSDLNLWKLPPEKLISTFSNIPFDILINLADSSDEVMTYLCAISKSKFKVGYVTYKNLYDLVVELNENNKHELTGEIIKTLRNLKRKE